MKDLLKQFVFKTRLYHLHFMLDRYYILPYHMITARPNGFFPEVSIRDFEKQIAYLARNYHFVSLDEIIDGVKNNRSLRRCVAVTFDDGFKDNYKNAYPILRKYQVPATIFLTTGCVESRIAPWFIKLRYLFMKTNKTYFRLPACEQLATPMRTQQEKFAASEKVMAYLKDCPDQQRLPVLDMVCRELAVNNFTEIDNLMLSWDEIREMSKNGISFGAHTVSHPILSRIPLAMAEEEILQSKQIIEKNIDRPVTGFAYPFGKEAQYSPDIFPILSKLRFSYAVTTRAGFNDRHTEAFALKRWGPWELSLIN